MQYNHLDIEKKWQKFWAENQTFKASNESEKPKYYVLDMFPYPSGAGLHVGHPLGYIASDIYARYKRHKGFNVLHPQGYDSFGLPAEQYAIQTGQHPAKTTEANIATYRKQLDKIGFSFDWSREVRTSNPGYYKWTQWVFIQLFNSWYNKDTDKAEDISTLEKVFKKEGNATVNSVSDEDIAIFSADEWKAFSKQEQEEILLQYRLTFLSDTEVNWCPGLGTVLANDEIVNGVSERGGHPVVRKKMTQWSMRISAYAQRLLDGLETIDWPQPLKDSQTNWIGKSIGAMVSFKVDGNSVKEDIGVKLSYKELEALKELRQNLTKAESTLWNELKNKKGASKFRKKYTIGTFLVDYVCISKNLIVEFSGKEDEAERTTYFNNEGFNVIRFTNEEILKNVEKVVSEINFAIQFPKVTPKTEKKEESASLSVDFEKYELENGLDVVLHQDKSDPIVSVAIQYGVGSNREKTGRTGFAHLFEHMLFQESENVPQDQFFKKIQDAGGTLNGGTWKDGTIYYEVVPKNAMEMVMWLESDRMGYFINTVTESAFYNQQEVVQNEKRQRVDNNPYGHTNWVLDKAIYPESHPYNWQVIGELVDLQNDLLHQRLVLLGLPRMRNAGQR